jgi:uncharacterized membrane protein
MTVFLFQLYTINTYTLHFLFSVPAHFCFIETSSMLFLCNTVFNSCTTSVHSVKEALVSIYICWLLLQGDTAQCPMHCGNFVICCVSPSQL